MKLTKKKAIKISIELWEYLAETGKEKWDWLGWAEYGEMASFCALCEYACCGVQQNCEDCPYYERFGYCRTDNAPYDRWNHTETTKDKKKYAKLFLKQLREL